MGVRNRPNFTVAAIAEVAFFTVIGGRVKLSLLVDLIGLYRYLRMIRLTRFIGFLI